MSLHEWAERTATLYKLRPEDATRSDILYLFDQGNLIFIQAKSGKSDREFRKVRSGNHAYC